MQNEIKIPKIVTSKSLSVPFRTTVANGVWSQLKGPPSTAAPADTTKQEPSVDAKAEQESRQFWANEIDSHRHNSVAVLRDSICRSVMHLKELAVVLRAQKR